MWKSGDDGGDVDAGNETDVEYAYVNTETANDGGDDDDASNIQGSFHCKAHAAHGTRPDDGYGYAGRAGNNDEPADDYRDDEINVGDVAAADANYVNYDEVNFDIARG